MSTEMQSSRGFDNNAIYFGQPLYEWVDVIHTTLSKDYDMKKFKIENQN